MSRSILLVEDDTALLRLIQDELEVEGYSVTAVSTVAEAGRRLDSGAFDLVVTDLRLPDGDGHAVVARAAECSPVPATLVITAFGTIGDAVEALKRGADDFLTKPLNMDHFLLTIERLVAQSTLRQDYGRMRELIGHRDNQGIVGSSPAIAELREQMQVIAATDGPVLITGESGTGKELVARGLHSLSARGENPFVAINCAGIPGDLIENELFGHEAGAFTDARARHSGVFRQADGGSLLLDEIGEMPLALQAKLLRVLQEGEVRPIGATREEAVDVRVIAATHSNVEELVAAGRFREDLYYRLETFKLHVPALRERVDDLELLARYFLHQHAGSTGKQVSSLSAAAVEALQRYPFPGNVRELSNVIERAVAFCRGTEIKLNDLPERVRDSGSSVASAPDAAPLLEDLPTLDTLQRRYARQVLERTEGNKQRAASILGITRSTLYRWLAEDGNER